MSWMCALRSEEDEPARSRGRRTRLPPPPRRWHAFLTANAQSGSISSATTSTPPEANSPSQSPGWKMNRHRYRRRDSTGVRVPSPPRPILRTGAPRTTAKAPSTKDERRTRPTRARRWWRARERWLAPLRRVPLRRARPARRGRGVCRGGLGRGRLGVVDELALFDDLGRERVQVGGRVQGLHLDLLDAVALLRDDGDAVGGVELALEFVLDEDRGLALRHHDGAGADLGREGKRTSARTRGRTGDGAEIRGAGWTTGRARATRTFFLMYFFSSSDMAPVRPAERRGRSSGARARLRCGPNSAPRPTAHSHLRLESTAPWARF